MNVCFFTEKRTELEFLCTVTNLFIIRNFRVEKAEYKFKPHFFKNLLIKTEVFACSLTICVSCTCEDGPSLALLLHAAMFLPRQRVRRLEHKADDVVALLKVCLLLGRLLLVEVGLDKRHLDVGEPGV